MRKRTTSYNVLIHAFDSTCVSLHSAVRLPLRAAACRLRTVPSAMGYPYRSAVVAVVRWAGSVRRGGWVDIMWVWVDTDHCQCTFREQYGSGVRVACTGPGRL